MNKNNAKLELLRSEIEKCAEKEAEEMVAAAEKEAADVLSQLEKELHEKRSGDVLKITESFRTAERKRVSEVCFAESKRVLLHRNELVESFFADVEKKLYDCLETSDYTEYLTLCVKKATDAFSLENAVVLCREKDTNELDRILKGIDCSLEATGNIRIGGIMVSFPKTGMLIDFTLDSALETEKEKFSSLKEMQL